MSILKVMPPALGGNDSNTYAQVATGLYYWATPMRAARGSATRSSPNSAEAAQPGDTTYIYDNNGVAHLYQGTGSAARYEPSLQPVNNGVSGQPISFEGVGTVRLGTNAANGPVIGSYQRDFVNWKNFTLDETEYTYASDTGPVVLWSGRDGILDDIRILGQSTVIADNHNGIRCEDYIRPTIRNCDIRNIYQSGFTIWHHNSAGIMLYGVTDFLIENCYFYRCGSGIFPKGTAQSGTLFNYGTARYNKFSEVAKGIRCTYMHATEMSNFYQNLILPSDASSGSKDGFQFNEYARNIRVYNNTIYNAQCWASSTVTGQSNIRLYNNIGYGDGSRIINLGETNADWEMDYNYYYNTNGFSLNGVNYSTIADWRTILGGVGSWNDNNSVMGTDPLFTDLLNGDFTLQVGSPARTASLTGGPIGCFITGSETMGPTAAAVATTILRARLGRRYVAVQR